MASLKTPIADPNVALEQVLIDEYLESRGHTRQSVRKLSEAEALRLLRGGRYYASLRLAVVESRAQYVEPMHKGT